jgi:hypothetical protein
VPLDNGLSSEDESLDRLSFSAWLAGIASVEAAALLRTTRAATTAALS